MPTVAGRPLNGANQHPSQQTMVAWGPRHVHDWISGGNQAGGVRQQAAMRGMPAPFAWWQRRAIRGPATVPQSQPVMLHSRGYSRGAQAYAPKFGVINYNPIGDGVVAPYKLPVIAGPGARYNFGAIWFDVQTIPTSIILNPTVPTETIDALLATSYVGGTYLTTG